MIKYSVIIPFHSNMNLLTLCVKALKCNLPEGESEIIIVDNNANGSEIPSDENIFQDCKILRKKDNLFYPRAINIGAEVAQGKYLIFCDADSCVNNDFCTNLTSVFADETIGYSSCKLINTQSNNILEFGTTFSNYNFPHPYCGRSLNFPLCTYTRDVMAACAACSSIPKQLFYDMGGFDETLIQSYSDIDLCLRLRYKGYRSVCVSNALAYHQGTSTIGSGMSAGLKEDTKGLFMRKHTGLLPQINTYLNEACDYFLSDKILTNKHYILFDCSSIGDSGKYVETIANNLNIEICERFRKPFPLRDAINIDFLNFISYVIRNYRLPILYFTDNFHAFDANGLWKSCRKQYPDIVADRHANILFLSEI